MYSYFFLRFYALYIFGLFHIFKIYLERLDDHFSFYILRQLINSNRQLQENITRESSVNKQLRLENEELQWKLRQRDQLSASLPVPTLGKHRMRFFTRNITSLKN